MEVPTNVGSGDADTLDLTDSSVSAAARQTPQPRDGWAGTTRDLAMLDALFAGATVGLGLFDERLRYVRVNPVLGTIIGLPEEQLVGRTIAEAVPGFGETVIPHMRRVLETGDPVRDIELWGRTPAYETTRCFSCSYFRLHDQAGRPIGIASVVVDATDRKAAQDAVDAATERLRLLSVAGQLLGASLDPEATLATIADLTVPEFADHCVVDLVAGGGTFRRAALVHSPDVPPGGEAWRGTSGTVTYPDAHPVAEVTRTRRPLLIRDIEHRAIDQAAPTAESAAWGRAVGLRSAITVPLVAHGGVLGTLSFATSVSGRRYEPADLELALDLAARAAVALDNAARYQRQHEVAVTLQRSLLPHRLADAPGLRTESVYLPGATEATVGGDWFDVIPLPDGRTGVVIGDVMGRGVRAAAVMGQLRAVVRSCAVLGLEPGALLGHLDELVQALDVVQIVTCLYGIHDPGRGVIRLANAGHLRPLLLSGGWCDEVDLDTGPPLGAGGGRYAEHELPLAGDAALVLYTDGLVERRNAHIDEGIDRLRAALATADADRPLCEAALAAAGDVVPDDDIAMLVLRPTADDTAPPAMDVTFGPSRAAPRAAREAVAATLTAWGLGTRVDTAVLVTSELVTNAINHAGTPVTVRLRLLDGRVRVEVGDGDPRLPVTVPSTEETGRGLQLVAGVATAWGARPTSHGKVVWADL